MDMAGKNKPPLALRIRIGDAISLLTDSQRAELERLSHSRVMAEVCAIAARPDETALQAAERRAKDTLFVIAALMTQEQRDELDRRRFTRGARLGGPSMAGTLETQDDRFLKRLYAAAVKHGEGFDLNHMAEVVRQFEQEERGSAW